MTNTSKPTHAANLPNHPPTATVLAVCRQQSMANWIGECLREAGYVVAPARGYEEALRTLYAIQPDAVIVSGGEVEGDIEQLRWLDSDPRIGSIPILLVAASSGQAALADIAGRKRFRGGFLPWPSTRADLQLIVKSLLNTDKQTRELVAGERLVLDHPSRILRGRAGITILTAVEYRLAHYLMSQGRRSIPMQDLVAHVFDFYTNGKSLDFVLTHVASLRQKIKIVTGGSDLIRVLGKDGIVYCRFRNKAQQLSPLP